MSMTVLYVLSVIVGSMALPVIGKKVEPERSYSSFALVVLLLLSLLFRLELFEVAAGRCSTGGISAGFLLILLFLLLEHDRLPDFYISRSECCRSLLAGLAACFLFVGPFFLLLITIRGGDVALAPEHGILTLLAVTVRIALFEELTFRSLLLGYLRRYSIAPLLANVVQVVYFAMGHPHYLVSRDWPMLGFVLGLGLVAGWIALRYRNLAGSVLVHVAGNLVPLLLGYQALGLR